MSEQSWTKLTWVRAVAVAAALIGSYAAAYLSGRTVPPSQSMMPCAASQVVMAQKRACGFLDLGELVTARGCVARSKIHTDGDASVDLDLDPEFEHLLTVEGHKPRGYLHTEVMPCEREFDDIRQQLEAIREHVSSDDFDRASCSMRVEVTGRYAWDGVDHTKPWKDNLGTCLNGRDADFELGWPEIHPVYSVRIL